MDTEGRLARYRDADRWPTEESLGAMLDNQQAAFVAVRNALPALARAAQGAAARLAEGEGRLIYTGAGASGRLAVQDGVELHPTFGWPHERLIYLLAGGDTAVIRVEPARNSGPVCRSTGISASSSSGAPGLQAKAIVRAPASRAAACTARV